MRIKTEYIAASRVIYKMAKKYGLSKNYLWDVAEENFNHIKGLGAVMTQEEIDTLEEICKHSLD